MKLTVQADKPVASARCAGHAFVMSDTSSPAVASLAFDHSPRRALAAMSEQDRDIWHRRYWPQEGAEPRILILLERVERELRAAGEPATIHALWVHLAGRAGQENNPDLQAATALAGMALGLRAG